LRLRNRSAFRRTVLISPFILLNSESAVLKPTACSDIPPNSKVLTIALIHILIFGYLCALKRLSPPTRVSLRASSKLPSSSPPSQPPLSLSLKSVGKVPPPLEVDVVVVEDRSSLTACPAPKLAIISFALTRLSSDLFLFSFSLMTSSPSSQSTFSPALSSPSSPLSPPPPPPLLRPTSV